MTCPSTFSMCSVQRAKVTAAMSLPMHMRTTACIMPSCRPSNVKRASVFTHSCCAADGLISTRIRSAEHALEQCASIRHCSSSRCMQCPRALGPSDHVSLDPWNSSSLGTRLHRLCRAPFLCALRRALPFGPVRCNRIRQSYTCSAHSLRHAADRSVCRASRRGVRCGACDSAEGTGSGCGAHRRSARRALQRCGSIHHWLCRGHYSASL